MLFACTCFLRFDLVLCRLLSHTRHVVSHGGTIALVCNTVKEAREQRYLKMKRQFYNGILAARSSQHTQFFRFPQYTDAWQGQGWFGLFLHQSVVADLQHVYLHDVWVSDIVRSIQLLYLIVPFSLTENTS
jgi:hypothetical protein